MFIQTERTPNPATLKFLPGEAVMSSGTADFRDVESAERSPLARRLFQIEDVTGVFFGGDFVSVSKADAGDWQMLKPVILGVIMEHFVAGHPLLLDDAAQTAEVVADDGADAEIIAQIKELLDTRVRPAVAQDGGGHHLSGFSKRHRDASASGLVSGLPQFDHDPEDGYREHAETLHPGSRGGARRLARLVFSRPSRGGRLGVLMGAEGRASARARRGSAVHVEWSRSTLPPAKETARSRRAALLSALGALGVAAVSILGVATAGTDLIRPAAAHTPMHLTLAAAKWAQAADAATADSALTAHMPAMPSRVRLVLSLSDVKSGEPKEAAWQEAVAVVPARPIGASSAAVMRLSPADLHPAPAPAPVMKPPVVARAVPDSAVPSVVPKPRSSTASVSAVIAGFASFGYDLDQVRAAAKPVPRLYLEALPRDLANVSSVETKKRLFVQTVLPIILRVNEEIVAARWRAERLADKLMWDGALSDADREWLVATAELYGTAPFDLPGLLSRMDIVPPSLALAQAAEETGWGTSRFAREGNALFGQYTYKSMMGMVPERRDADRRHRVRSHDNLLAAVRSYVHNLNSHWAYEDFRDRRAELRRAGGPIDGYNLAGKLGQYSERRAAYVQTIRQIIRQNRLRDFDEAWLNNRQWTALIGPPGNRPI